MDFHCFCDGVPCTYLGAYLSAYLPTHRDSLPWLPLVCDEHFPSKPMMGSRKWPCFMQEGSGLIL